MIRVFSPACVFLLLAAVAVANSKPLVRKRREWILPPKPLLENKDYTNEEYVAKIRSDFEDGKGNIDYSLEGIGATQYPFNVFVVDHKTGLIRVRQLLDREFIHTYNLSGVARFLDGRHAEEKIDIRIKVVDENDNSPTFGVTKPAWVYEHSPVDTEVMTVIANDADEPGNPNSQIAYSLLKQNPPDDMFYIKRDGTICVKRDTLDRETTDQYILTVRGQDLNGDPKGNTGTGTVTINVRDVNDHLPTLEKNEYEGNIEENIYGVEVMRLKALDKDQEGTPNWEAVFEIIKGNEVGYFSITTDPKTNEGILMLDKAVDYEEVRNLDLGIIVKNKVPQFDGSTDFDHTDFGFGPGGSGASGASAGGASGASGGGASGATGSSGGGPSGASSGSEGGPSGANSGPSNGPEGGPSGPSSGGPSGPSSGPEGGPSVGSGGTSSGNQPPLKTYAVKINVKNQPEGPTFDPEVKAIPISEGGDVNIDDVIGHYPAIDGDTGEPAENVNYAKGFDPANWLTIDPETAEIKLNKKPDRESPYLVNGTYIAKILCISQDIPGKTATGTIAIQVEDFNDHCPELTSNIHSMCTSDNAIIVNALDEDTFPNGPPFHFTIIPEGTQGKWQVEHFNDTAAILRTHESMWPGEYEVEFMVTDMQGHACPETQRVKIQVCTCEDGVMCAKRGANGQPSKSMELGPAAIGLLLLGLLLLLLIPLLALFCLCGGVGGMPLGFAEMPFDTKSHLINYHTEGQGENTEVPLLTMPTAVDMGFVSKTSEIPTMAGFGYDKSVMSIDGTRTINQDFGAGHMEETWGSVADYRGFGFHSEFEGRESRGMFDHMALPNHFLGQYYTEKLSNGNENLGVKDSLLVYDYEGQGSSAGSVGCCSSLGANNDLQFLDDLGPKFKTLAEVCGGKKISAEIKPVITPLPSTSINTEIKPVIPPLPSTSINTQTSVSSVMSTQQLPPPPKLQPTVSKTEQTVVRETSERSQIVKDSMATLREGTTKVKGGTTNQSQVLLLQQQQQPPPVYYTTAPVMQPMHYVVQPQIQNTMLLAEAPATNLQGMVLVNGTQTIPAQGLVVQGQTVMSSGQAPGPSMVLVNNSGSKGLGPNLIHTGTLSGSQAMLVVDGAVPSGSKQSVKGGQTLVVQEGTLQPGGLSGSQRVLVVGGSTSNTGQLVQAVGGLKRDLSGSNRVLHTKSSTSTSSATTVNTTPTYRRVVVQETKEITK